MVGLRSGTSRMPRGGFAAPFTVDRVPPIRLAIELLVLAVVVTMWTSGAVAKLGSNLASDRADLVETQRRMTLQWMRGVVPPDATVVAWFAGDASDDLMLVCRFAGSGSEPTWSETMVLWNRATVPGVLVGIADRPIELPPRDATIDSWRLYLMDSRVRLLPLGRPDAVRRTTSTDSTIGRRVPIDPCLQ